MLKFIIPLIIFSVMAIFLAIGLNLNPKEIPSPLINKNAPVFTAPILQTTEKQLSTEELKGSVWILNVWASWCSSCREEHNALKQFQTTMPNVLLVGLDYKDEDAAALNWLEKLGNPYHLVVTDKEGRIGLDWGVYGVPEIFVIDKKGIIRYKHTGPVTFESIQNTFLPLLQQLEREL